MTALVLAAVVTAISWLGLWVVTATALFRSSRAQTGR